MAGIKAPLQDILTQLATLQVRNGDGQTVNLYTRVWNDQLKSEQDGKLYDFQKPAAFVEIISPVQYEELGGNYRIADIGINIHLVHEYFNGETTFEQDLVVFDIRDSIIALLSQYQPTGCGLMVCVNETQDTNHDNLYHFVIGFATAFVDSKGSKFDTGRGVYMDSTTPTDVQMTVTLNTSPINDPASANQTTINR